ncbi:MAG: nucleoside triphosphate pyrophosphohydrolase [Candidatus Pacebacteria bacterium]|nr:nucleoside triphosphate pyrophosphohydrolase [Candidatus Paceibacterota bacterium]MBP9772561.1 nucleoside triphosphate pyrophosphohydrolase [Candidatus Paceibacterota bacterium]QQR77026.1 MAG: nucleoside triphosphate pyrophosphohydrolase [Candidatus Nomurabacteria bacterium]
MVKISYDKLVRDLIPEHLASNGVEFKTHIADDIEYEDKLFAKLKEEASELAKDKNIDEVADVLEVVDAICAYKGFSKKEIELRRLEKFEKKGGFSNKIILEETLN